MHTYYVLGFSCCEIRTSVDKIEGENTLLSCSKSKLVGIHSGSYSYIKVIHTSKNPCSFTLKRVFVFVHLQSFIYMRPSCYLHLNNFRKKHLRKIHFQKIHFWKIRFQKIPFQKKHLRKKNTFGKCTFG